jgi:hypothetical protein
MKLLSVFFRVVAPYSPVNDHQIFGGRYRMLRRVGNNLQ